MARKMKPKIEVLTPAQEVRATRQALGITQAELATRVGVGWRQVAHWEAGTRKPSGPAKMLLAQLREGVRPS